jgi:membrane associated rhomboid family serine protease
MFGVFPFLLILANVIVSYQGFKNQFFMDRYQFEVEKILVQKDYKRLVTSGFLHVGWMHLIFNMLSLYFFSDLVESQFGIVAFLVIYFISLIGSGLFSLLVHKQHSDYSSIGASGAVSGIVFAGIAQFPNMDLRIFFLPGFPAWIYGLAYMLYSIYGIRSRMTNVGHDAHLAGAMIGMMIAIALQPSSLVQHPVPILLMAVPTIVFIYIIVTRPAVLLVDNLFYKNQRRHYNIDQRYNAEKMDKQKELDRLLEKIHKKGMSSLSAKEKIMLAEYSKEVL